MSDKDAKDILARENQQQRTLGKNRTRMYSSRDCQAQINGIGLATHCANQQLIQQVRPFNGIRRVKER